MRLQQRQTLTAWGFLAVPLFFYVTVRFWPALDAFLLSLSRWNLVGPRVFVGFANYARIFSDGTFLQILGNSFEYLILGLPISLGLAFLVAYHLDRVRAGHAALRALYFLPHLTTATAMAFVWRWLYQPPPIGMINALLGSFGIPAQPFLRSTAQALPAVLAPAIWAALGLQIVILLAGLKAIPAVYLDAAAIDGASAGQTLRYVTLPLLRPTLVFLVVTSSIGFLRIFDWVYNMTDGAAGGPLNSTKPLVLSIYQSAFARMDMGTAAAQTFVLFVILLVLSLVQLRFLRARA
ncbi:MAG TPA: sugar ABC transporter permease [Acetobacteraceae bacterium]|jgi:multiple sugar transport system permease protein|nr:sugar ABC transporter permease [Acetobacteraceae bacterium]